MADQPAGRLKFTVPRGPWDLGASTARTERPTEGGTATGKEGELAGVVLMLAGVTPCRRWKRKRKTKTR